MRIFWWVILFVTLVVFFSYNNCFLEENPPLADPYFWDFGKVSEGIVLKHVFNLKNDSPTTLVIKNLQTSCGCTGSVVSRNEIPPGKVSKVKVTFKTKGYSGKVKQYVYVYTTQAQNPIIKLTVEAEVIKEK